MGRQSKFGEQNQSALTARHVAAVLDAALVPKTMDDSNFLERLAKIDPDAAWMGVLHELDQPGSGRVQAAWSDKHQCQTQSLW